MGFFSKLFGSSGGGTGGRITVERSDEYLSLLRQGYIETSDHKLFPPDTVWATVRSKVYHSGESCGGGVSTGDEVPLHESEALRRGQRRCKKCEWYNRVQPEPAHKPMPQPKSLMQAKVTPGWRK